MLFKDALERWLPFGMQAFGRRTVEGKLLVIKAHIIPYFGEMKIGDITPEIMLKYFALKAEHGSPIRHPGGLAPSTLSRHRAIFNSLFEYCAEEGLIAENPCERIKLARKWQNEIEVFTVSEVYKLIAAAHHKWLAAAIELSFRTGLRRGEVFGLKWQDIDLNAGILSVKRVVVCSSHKVCYIKRPKTKASIRDILLDDKCVKMLREMKVVSKSAWVISRDGVNMTNHFCVTDMMRTTCKNAGIPRRGFHSLRHTHCTELLNNKMYVRSVQERIGHSSVYTTLNTYGHVRLDMQQEAVNIFNTL